MKITSKTEHKIQPKEKKHLKITMKHSKSILSFLFFGAISLTACKKESLLQPETVNETFSEVSNFKDLKVQSNFDWKLTNEITLNVIAFPAPVKIENTLTVKTESGDVVFKKLQQMNQPFTGKFLLPSKETKLIISFGSISKTVDITNNRVEFDYLIEN